MTRNSSFDLSITLITAWRSFNTNFWSFKSFLLTFSLFTNSNILLTHNFIVIIHFTVQYFMLPMEFCLHFTKIFVSINNHYWCRQGKLLLYQPVLMKLMKTLQVLQWNEMFLPSVPPPDPLHGHPGVCPHVHYQIHPKVQAWGVQEVVEPGC